MFAFTDRRGAVEVAFTDRHGGVSTGAFTSLNLGSSAGDDPEAVGQNLRLVAGAFTGTPEVPPLARMHQVHGAEVAVVDASASADDRPPVCDGIVTAAPGVVLMVRAADCVPVLLADPTRRVVGAAHAGRTGLVAGVVPATVARMRDLGADAIAAWLGPHVCGGCYEVPRPLRAEVAAVVPEAHAETTWGTPAVDVGAGVRAQLAAEGVEVVEAARCTVEDRDLFSYRRQGRASGRLGGLVWVRP